MNLQTSPAPVYQPACEIYYVPSSANVKNPGQTRRYYAVTNQRGVWRCECKAGSFGRDCWHVAAAVSGAVKPARLKVQPSDNQGERRPTVWERERERMAIRSYTAAPDAAVTCDDLYA